MSLLTTIIPLLSRSTGKLNIEIQGMGDGRIKAIVSPLVGEIAEGASEEERKLKAALSMPLKCIGSPNEIESDLDSHVRNFVFKRNQWEASLNALDAVTPNIEGQEVANELSENIQVEQRSDKTEIDFDL